MASRILLISWLFIAGPLLASNLTVDYQLASNTSLNNPHDLKLSPELEILRELDRKTYDFNGVRYMGLLADGTLVASERSNT